MPGIPLIIHILSSLLLFHQPHAEMIGCHMEPYFANNRIFFYRSDISGTTVLTAVTVISHDEILIFFKQQLILKEFFFRNFIRLQQKQLLFEQQQLFIKLQQKFFIFKLQQEFVFVKQFVLTQLIELQRRLVKKQLLGRRKQQRSKSQRRWQLQTLT